MKIEAKELRKKNFSELISILTEAKKDLMIVVQKRKSEKATHTDVKIARENIGRIQTILHEKKIYELVDKVKQSKIKKIPKELKPRMTRKLRRGLNKKQMKILKSNGPKKIKMKCFAFIN